MHETYPSDVRRAVTAAADEAIRRGDRRIGTDHLLFGVLATAEPEAIAALGTDFDSASAAFDRLDVDALGSIGIRATAPPVSLRQTTARRLPLTSASRAVLQRSLRYAVAARGRRRIHSDNIILSLLDCTPPDPAAALLDVLGCDRAAIRDRLG